MRRKLSISVHLSILTVFLASFAVAQIRTPQPSPAGSVSSTVGLTEVKIDYFRPKVKGRMIFGEGSDYLVPFGQIWRTGANSGSKLSLSTDAKIGGKDVAAGEYLIFSKPGASSWDFMLYSDLSLGGNVNGYDAEKEVIKVSVTPSTLNESVENMTFQIADISVDNTKANIHLAWDKTSIKVPIEVSFDEMVMKQIAANTQVNPSNYVQAASYYFNTGKDLNQALEWINMYFADGKNENQFWNVHLKAQILAKMGKDKEAIETAEQSMAKAKANASGDFGYVKRNEDLIAEIKNK
jgi:hypothetical protein